MADLDAETSAAMVARIETSEQVFRLLRKQYAKRKSEAEAKVVEWKYSKRALADFRPLHDEEFGWPPGQPLKSKPASMKNIFANGLDESGRVVVENRYTELARRFGEMFVDRTADPIVMVCYGSEEVKDPESVTLIEVREGRVMVEWGTGQEGSFQRIYTWADNRCVRVDTYEAGGRGAKRTPMTLLVFAVATYDAAGVLQRVARYASEDDTEPEITFELRDGKPWWRQR